MSEEERQIRLELLDRLRDEHRRDPRSAEWLALEAELEAAGIDVTDLGIFQNLGPTTFDYDAAAPHLVEWLPRVRDPVEKEVIARALTGTKTAPPEAGRALVAEFRTLALEEESVKWAIGNALATLADREVADDLLDLLRDRRHGDVRPDALRGAEANEGFPSAQRADRGGRRRRRRGPRDPRSEKLRAEKRVAPPEARPPQARGGPGARVGKPVRETPSAQGAREARCRS